MERVAIVITNYNMPERTDALCDYIEKHAAWPHDLIVVDNGSDITEPSQFTTLRLEKNIQTTGGWLAGLAHADDLAEQRGVDYLAYWFLITSAKFPDDGCQNADPLTPLAQVLIDDPNAVGVHPALTQNSTTAWNHMKWRGKSVLRQTWMIDNIASLYRADWFNGIGRWDPELIYAWGIDLETCYKARLMGRGLYIHEGVQIEKETDIGYTMDRMRMSAVDRQKLARANVSDVLGKRYGQNWWHFLTKELVTNGMV